MSEKREKAAKKPPDKNKARKGTGDMKKDAAAKVQRVANRVVTLNRRYFSGTQADLLHVADRLGNVITYIHAQPDGWKPRAKGKTALIVGMKVMLRPDLTEKELKQYDWIDDIQVLNGALITSETDERNVVVKRLDGVKTRILKKHLCQWFPTND